MQQTPRSLPLTLLVALVGASFGVGRLGWSPNPAGDERSSLERAQAAAGDLSLAFQDLSARAGQAVVSVRAQVERRRNRFQRLAQGSGVIIDAEGLIVTNNHVIRGADRLVVVLSNGSERTAELVGADPESDLALLRITGDDYASLAYVEPQEVTVGEWVLALGNPLGYGASVSAGIVSGTGRADIQITTYEDFVQTDAAINPGNSGGALVDLDGRLVGINTAMGTGPGGNLGIGFAIPAYMVRRIVAEILEEGRVRRGWLGIRMNDLSESEARQLGFEGTSRVVVNFVFDESPAEKSGIELGDVVLAIHGDPVHKTRDLLHAIGEIDPGSQVELQLWRDGRELEVSVELRERTAEALNGTPGR